MVAGRGVIAGWWFGGEGRGGEGLRGGSVSFAED